VVAEKRYVLNAHWASGQLKNEEIERDYLQAVSTYLRLNGMAESRNHPVRIDGIAAGSSALRHLDNQVLQTRILEERTVTLRSFKDQIENVRSHWEKKQEHFSARGGPPLSAVTGIPCTIDELKSHGSRKALLSPYWSSWLECIAISRAQEKYAKTQIGADNLPSDYFESSKLIRDAASNLPQTIKDELAQRVTIEIHNSLMDNSGYWTQLDREYEKCITDQHTLMDELLHRGILQPIHSADLRNVIPHIEKLVYTDPTLFTMIVSELDLSELLIFTHQKAHFEHDAWGRYSVIGLMFLVQAINMHSVQGVAHALWDGRSQIYISQLQLLIAKQHAKYNHFEEAVERIDNLLNHRIKYASGWNPMKLSEADRKLW